MSQRASANSEGAAAAWPAAGGLLQRKCACGKNTAGGGDCNECSHRSGRLQRRSAGAPEDSTRVPDSVHEVLDSPGSPLDAATRALFESRFGHDFRGVRVHTDARAQESARAANALAYTVGQHIVLRDGRGIPDSADSLKTMAHELAHTIQQRGRTGGLTQVMSVTSPSDHSEREAETAAEAVLARHSPDPWPGLMRGTHVGMTQSLANQPKLSLSKRPLTLQRRPGPQPALHEQEVIFSFYNCSTSTAGSLPMWNDDPLQNSKLDYACLAVKEIINKGYVKIRGDCTKANDASSDQEKQEAVWIANAQVRAIENRMMGRFSGKCGELLNNPDIKISRTPPGIIPPGPGGLPPATALSIFPKLLHKSDTVEVKIGGSL